jgi:hypothetical protein
MEEHTDIGIYGYEFPPDALEMPASRKEEIRFNRLAYDRDPVVAFGIEQHIQFGSKHPQLTMPPAVSKEYSDCILDFYSTLGGKQSCLIRCSTLSGSI